MHEKSQYLTEFSFLLPLVLIISIIKTRVKVWRILFSGRLWLPPHCSKVPWIMLCGNMYLTFVSGMYVELNIGILSEPGAMCVQHYIF